MSRRKKTRIPKSKHSPKYSGLRVAILCIFVGVGFFLVCSCLSFNIADWPSKSVFPHNKPTANWCGSIGSFCAYYSLYYVGPGVFIVYASIIVFCFAKLFKVQVGQTLFRLIGLIFITIAASSTFYSFWPRKLFLFPIGSGGVLGLATLDFLRGYFAGLGTFLLLAATWFVGIALLADSLIVGAFAIVGITARRIIGILIPAWSVAKEQTEMLGDIWQKLSARQKSQTEKRQDVGELFKQEQRAKHNVEAEPVRQEVAEIKKPNAVKVRRAEAEPVKPVFVQPSYDDYTLPPLDLLAEPEFGYAAVQEKVVKAKATALEKLLSEFGINARVVAAETGPVVTMFELELAAGIKVSRISTLSNDMARALGAGAVRVVAPLPGKHTIGIEVPNSEKEKVRIKSMIQLGGGRASKMEIPLFLGKDSSGEALVSDLTRMPHLLIAGTTGSGKSVCINSIIVGILLTKRPDEVKLILIDPKMVEMTAFNMVPHLMCPIVTETQTAVQILEWATVKMDERYAILAEARVKNVAEFNMLGAEEIIKRFNPSTEEEEAKIPKKLPYIVIVIDELADLMMTAAKEIEAYIVRLAQKSRAVGIHIVLATQRPQATVVTGLIKSNMPTRIGFRVAAKMDSRIILDQNGAETLLGEGDMLFLKPGTSDLIRAQGTFVDEMEIKRIVKHLREIAEPQFHPELTQLRRIDTMEMKKDELFDEAVRIVLETDRGSVSLLQRRLNVGYARASRMIEMMAAAGILGEYKGSQAREVLITLDEYESIREKMEAESQSEEDEDSDSQGQAYISEGQRGYISVEDEQ